MSKDPIDNIVWRKADELSANAWNPNRVMTPELLLLERSILSTGWIQPIMTNAEGVIIDGFHRWRLSQDSPQMRKRWKKMVPTVCIDVDVPTAMAMTVRMNRAKGSHQASHMSEIANAIVHHHGWSQERLAVEIGADESEVELLLMADVFALRNIAQWAYSKAWYPVEKEKMSQLEAEELAAHAADMAEGVDR